MEAMATGSAQNRTLRLDKALPEYEFADVISVPVLSSPNALLRAFRQVTLQEMPVARVLGNLRYLPGRLLGRTPKAPSGTQPFVKQLIDGGNVVLAELPEREVVLGSIGKFHQLLNQEPVVLRNVAEFRKFDDPHYEKLAMSIRVEDRPDGRWLLLEHRTHALSPHSRRAFARYWLVIKPTGHFVTWLLLLAVRRRAERSEAKDSSPTMRRTQAIPPTGRSRGWGSPQKHVTG